MSQARGFTDTAQASVSSSESEVPCGCLAPSRSSHFCWWFLFCLGARQPILRIVIPRGTHKALLPDFLPSLSVVPPSGTPFTSPSSGLKLYPSCKAYDKHPFGQKSFPGLPPYSESLQHSITPLLALMLSTLYYIYLRTHLSLKDRMPFLPEFHTAPSTVP